MPVGTRERLLDVAEELFAERGIAGTSLRLLTKTAGVNLAAVHYHFGSKEALLDAVFERRAGPMNIDRIADLARLEGAAGDATPSAEEILTAFIVPGVRRLETWSERRELLGRLRARIEAEPSEVVEALFRRHFGAVCARFLEALERALPELSKELVADRFRFALGTLSFAFSESFDLDTIPGHPASASRPGVKAKRLIDFLAAGLCAPEAPADTDPADPLAPLTGENS